MQQPPVLSQEPDRGEASASRAPAARPRSRSLWRNRDYMLLWSGQTVSTTGTLVSGIAFPLLILAVTRSPAQAGIAGALRSVPYVFLSLPVGALIDRWDRKRVMIVCDAGRALALGSIPVTLALGRLSVAQIYLVSFVEGTLFVFFNIAEVACLPRVVSKEQLPAATAQNRGTDAAASLLGPSLSGLLYTLSKALPFVADAISYTVSVASLLFIRTAFQGERCAARRSLQAEIGEGLIWLWRQPLIRYIAFLTGGLNFVTAGFPLMLIVIAQRQGASPAVIGLIFAIEGIGTILGAVVAVRLQKRVRYGPAIIGSVWIWTLIWPLYAIAPNPLLLGVFAAAGAITGPLYDVVQFSYRLSIIPDALQGRVNSVFRLLAFGFQPLGFTLTGVLLQSFGPVPTVLAAAGVLMGLAALTTLNPHVRQATAHA
jgi:predicted MFS family arabinose efflux permease